MTFFGPVFTHELQRNLIQTFCAVFLTHVYSQLEILYSRRNVPEWVQAAENTAVGGMMDAFFLFMNGFAASKNEEKMKHEGSAAGFTLCVGFTDIPTWMMFGNFRASVRKSKQLYMQIGK